MVYNNHLKKNEFWCPNTLDFLNLSTTLNQPLTNHQTMNHCRVVVSFFLLLSFSVMPTITPWSISRSPPSSRNTEICSAKSRYVSKPVQRHYILDVGCGTGESTRDIHRYFFRSQVIGIDRDPLQIRTATTRFPELVFFQEDILETKLPSSWFHLVVMKHFLSDTDPNQQKIFHRISTLMIPNGECLICESLDFTLPPCYTSFFTIKKHVQNSELQYIWLQKNEHTDQSKSHK